MNTTVKMAIKEFSTLTGISKDTLRFYDKISLLSPQLRGENGYRYYTERQLELAFLISDLRALGIGLEEIKKYANERSADRMLTFLAEQNAHVEQEIKRLRSIQELMQLRTSLVSQALCHEDNTIFLEEKKKEPIFLCPTLDVESLNADDLTVSYNYAAEHGVNVAFPVCALIAQHDFETGNWSLPSRYYFKVREHHNAWKSAGTYAVFYRRFSENPGKDFYRPLLLFLSENKLRPTGNAYEEYPLDELSTKERENYRVRVEVRVTS